ncbi:MAG: hypothetical protein B7Y33_03045, partial [Hydrogenophilales bacterium 16-62-9]
MDGQQMDFLNARSGFCGHTQKDVVFLHLFRHPSAATTRQCNDMHAAGVSGSNGIYAYAASTTFPTSTYLATNYWIDVVFNTGATPPPTDTTPPTISAVTPASAATGVSASTTVTATFSEAL